MPKSVKGIRGIRIEEVREAEVAEGGGSEITKIPPTEKIETSRENGKQEVQVREEIDEVMEKSLEASKTGHGKESKEATSEKVNPAPAATTRTYQEKEMTKQKEAEQERKLEEPGPTEQLKTEETSSAMLSDLIEKVEEEKIPEAESDKPEEGSKGVDCDTKVDDSAKEEQLSKQAEISSAQQAQVEEENIKGKTTQVEPQMQEQDSEKRDFEEQVDTKPDQEIEQATPPPDLPVNQENKTEEANREEEIHKIEDKIEKEITDRVEPLLPQEKVVENLDSSEAEEQEGLRDHATETRKPPSKRSNQCAPCFYAGSAILVTLIVLVFFIFLELKKDE